MIGEELGCLSARKVLEFMWNHDLLSVYYLCEMQNSTMVFTLNPYARYAPAPWKLIDQFDDSDKNLVAFSLEYTKGSTICNSIIFDKTDHLENAEIKFVQLNEDKPFSEEENREYAESVVKIAFLMGKSLLLIMFTILMVMININQVFLAVMDMTRLVTGIALETPLHRLVMKFIFFFGFLFAFLIVPDFLGQMLSILSKPSACNVDKLRDLYERKFHVYYLESFESDLINQQLWVTDEDKKYLDPISSLKIQKCFEEVQSNSTVACITDTQRFFYHCLYHIEKKFCICQRRLFSRSNQSIGPGRTGL